MNLKYFRNLRETNNINNDALDKFLQFAATTMKNPKCGVGITAAITHEARIWAKELNISLDELENRFQTIISME